MTTPKLFEYYQDNHFNPTAFDIEAGEAFEIHEAKRFNLYVNRLKLPPLIWKDTHVLEAGCSSGENALVLAKWGAKFTFIEPWEESIVRLRKLFQKFRYESAIQKIDITTLEKAALTESFDIIIAEGFLHTLEHRREAARKLFSALKSNGLLILNTPDPIGMFLEYFKGVIVNLFCQQQKITALEDKVKAAKLFFEDDYQHIPHSRPFAAWAKDNLFNPLFLNYHSFCYGFDQIIKDLAGGCPHYYSSWPSYQHANDLTWYKKVPSYDEHLAQVFKGYEMRQITFLSGECLPEEESLARMLHPQARVIVQCVKQIMDAECLMLQGQLSEREIIEQLRILAAYADGNLQMIVNDMIKVFSNIKPEIYKQSAALRSFWGAPCHYLVLRR